MLKANLLDIAKRNGNDATVGIVDFTLQENALLSLLPFRPINGVSFKYGRRVDLPTVGFKGYNEGVAASKSKIDQVVFETKNIGGKSEVDQLLAEADPRGVDAYRQEEDAGFSAAMGNTYNYAAYYGDSTKSKGKEYDGVATILNDLAYDNVISAGGSTAGSQTSIYAFAFTDAVGPAGRSRGVEGILGNGKNITGVNMGLQYVPDADGNEYLAYVTDFQFAPGFAVYDMKSVGRICNIDDANTVTIKMLNKLKLKMRPFRISALMCSEKAYEQLQDLKITSMQTMNEDRDLFRSVLTYDGIPIFIDDNIKEDEEVVA